MKSDLERSNLVYPEKKRQALLTKTYNNGDF